MWIQTHNNESSTQQEELAKYLNCNIVIFFVRLRRKAYIARHNFKGTVTRGITERIVAAQQKATPSKMMKDEFLHNHIIKAQHKNIYKLTVCRCVYFLHVVGTVQIYSVGS
jgi:hypothetical protein